MKSKTKYDPTKDKIYKKKISEEIFQLTETKLHALYAAPIVNGVFPRYFLKESVDTK